MVRRVFLTGGRETPTGCGGGSFARKPAALASQATGKWYILLKN